MTAETISKPYDGQEELPEGVTVEGSTLSLRSEKIKKSGSDPGVYR
ncbi:hypothetical protein [Ruminococcus sp.]|nr:hypothetical protein [Ruminococcus sp.]MBQ8967252.1 hypothetical protein [Ruminococcus sp.]